MKTANINTATTSDNPFRTDTISFGRPVVQHEREQRYTTDDILLARQVIRTLRKTDFDTLEILEPGSGIGSISLIILLCLPGSRVTCVELNRTKTQCMEQSIRLNRLKNRCRIITGDVRRNLPEQTFDAVVSNPPYFKRESGITTTGVKADSRFSLNGSTVTFLSAAADRLRPGGTLFFSCPAERQDELTKAVEQCGLMCSARTTVIPKQGKPPLFTLLTFKNGDTVPSPPGTLTVRDTDGHTTQEYNAAREEIGFAPQKGG